MLNILSSSNLSEIFDQYFKIGIQKTLISENHNFYHINNDKLREITYFIREKGGNLINISIIDKQNSNVNLDIVYEYYFQFQREKKYWFIITGVKEDSSMETIQKFFPQAKHYEVELGKRHGIAFNSNNRELEKQHFVIPINIKPYKMTNNFTPIGIYNKIHNENNYFHLSLKRQKILKVTQKTGWLYRAIIPLLKNKTFKDNLLLTRRICSSSSYHHNLAYILGLEQLMNILIQNRVKLIRTLFCELERFDTLLLWFINLLHLLEYKTIYHNLLKLRKELHSLFNQYLHVRFLDEINSIGHCNDFSNGNLIDFQSNFKSLQQKIFKKLHFHVYSKHMMERSQGIGVLEKKDAIKSGVTGLCLRASGINYDIRMEKPYLSYLDHDISMAWDIITSKEGDCLARIETRLWEMKNSAKIVDRIVPKLIDDESDIIIFKDPNLVLPIDKSTAIQVESPQGELVYHLKTNEVGDPMRFFGVYINTPSMKNFLALNDYILKDSFRSDMELILHSMDLNFNEIDL